MLLPATVTVIEVIEVVHRFGFILKDLGLALDTSVGSHFLFPSNVETERDFLGSNFLHFINSFFAIAN